MPILRHFILWRTAADDLGIFLPRDVVLAQCMLSSCLSVGLCVCLSVCHKSEFYKTAEHRTMQTISYNLFMYIKVLASNLKQMSGLCTFRDIVYYVQHDTT